MRTFLRNRGIRLIAALAIATGTAGVASLTALSTTQASADPASVTGHVGVGSDVTQDFFDSLSGADGANSPTATFYTPLHLFQWHRQRGHPFLRRLPGRRIDVEPGLHHHRVRRPVLRPPNSSTAGITAL